MKYYIALYQKLKDIYFSQSSRAGDLVLICPSLRLYEMDDLQLLKPQSLIGDLSKVPDSILKKQQVSYELNSIPNSDEYWDLNPNNTLFDAYREILNYATVKELAQGLDAVVNADYPKLITNGKETPEYKAYKKQMNLYVAQTEKIAEHLALFDELDTDEEKQNWTAQLAVLKSKKDQALAEWGIKGYKTMIEEALEAVNKLSEADKFLDLFRSVKNNFDAAEKTDVTALSAIHDINFIPYDFMENESGWTYLFLDKNELESLFATAKNNARHLPEEILDIEYDEKYIDSIEFDYAFVHLKRGWFNKQIFNSGYFQWKESQPISDGETVSTDFKLPAFPKTMLLIKNLKINLNDAVSESQVNSQDQIIHFGPMILKQQLFVNKSTNRKFLKTVTNKDIIKSDQMNYMIRKAEETETVSQPVKAKEGITVGGNTIKIPLTRNILLRNKIFERKENQPVTVGQLREKKLVASQLAFKRGDIFAKIDVKVPSTVARIFFNITDSNSRKGIYKCALSIKGKDNNRVIEIETDENGQISASVPVGNYDLEARIDGYQILNKSFAVQNTNPLTLSYAMNREEIKFKSFFLIGMVCERIPKI